MLQNSRIASVDTLSCSAGWRNYYFVKIVTEGGIVGWSEFDEGFGSPGVGTVIRQLGGRTIGQSVMQHEKIWCDLHCVTRPGSGGVIGQALGAIENALLDAKAKVLQVPCYELLGGKVRDTLRVYWSHCVTWRASRAPFYQPVVTTKEDVRALAAEVKAKGFTALKTNVFSYENNLVKGWAPGFGTPFSPELNVARKVMSGLREHLQVMRDGAGPEMDIMLDLNFNAKTEGYLEIIRAIADFDLTWVELDTLNPHALATIRSRSPHPIASCETLIGLQQFLPFFREQAIDIAIVDTPWNGVWQSLKIAAAAEAYEINVACHNFYGHLCTMMNAHFCAAIPNFRIMEVDIDRIAWDHELYSHVPQYKDGHLIMPDRPGWGTEPVESTLLNYPPLQTHGFLALGVNLDRA